MRISAALPTGVAALLFDSAARRRALESRLVPRLEAAGYAEAILPVLDYAEPYEPLLDPARRAQLYRFVARDGELLALRADFTPMLARLLAPRADALPRPLRLYYRGDVVRFEEARAGQLREFYQLGAELLGEPGEGAEREILSLCVELLIAARAAGTLLVTQPAIVLSFAGALDAALAAAPVPAAALAAVARRERGPLRAAGGPLLAVAEHGVPERATDLGPAGEGRFERLSTLVGEMRARFPGVAFHVDLAEFAGQVLDPALAAAVGARAYYDGLVFRVYAGGGLPVGGGGRYDRLYSQLGADLPAVGFALGIDRLDEHNASLPGDRA